MSTTSMSDEIESLYVTGLRNAHAVETEAEQVIQRQLDRLENYPQLAQQLRLHLAETERQKERLNAILARFDTSPSTVKEAVMGVMGNMAAMAHSVADDEILKNTFANAGLEAYEVSAYKSLIAMAEQFNQAQDVASLRQSLEEEQRMLQWLDQHVDEITRQHIALRASGQKADR